MKFEVGDIVICVNNGLVGKYPSGWKGNLPPLKIYGEYEVRGVKTDCCGGILIDVGLNNTSIISHCSKCLKIEYNTDNIWWVLASRFRKKNNLLNEFKAITYSRILELEVVGEN